MSKRLSEMIRLIIDKQGSLREVVNETDSSIKIGKKVRAVVIGLPVAFEGRKGPHEVYYRYTLGDGAEIPEDADAYIPGKHFDEGGCDGIGTRDFRAPVQFYKIKKKS